ncbi:MAG: hypothetical protein UX31_C0011G0017 [Candidatus Nomurabacteria bacterium GW2011_GWA1_46_11]|uniref:Uncharacterized protein n=2 Tax=Parcubacteria group TaxID=1794811 RepID=A0A1F8EYJ6_9BACT|nr:MAG: hypothetical protein UX31_C0011G0017 [Candidatus Nomurabacteria bacterium GW2011_GWA1_46_11]OGN05945.1 MAG: hypothetical protein A2669_01085 [Candidatus Yanofskybacteria bacterium RIFCSPHIGHO2_01_FULL_48_25b]
MKRFFSLFLLVALTAACNNTSANDARRYVQGEYPEYKILLEPVATTSGEVFDGNRYILCSPANRIAAAQIQVSWGDVSGVRMTEIDPQTTPTLCGDAAKEPSKMAEKLARITEAANDESAPTDVRLYRVKTSLKPDKSSRPR